MPASVYFAAWRVRRRRWTGLVSKHFEIVWASRAPRSSGQLILRSAAGAGFTGIESCAADTTVQGSPIAYPTEVGHLKDKILKFGKKLKLPNLAELRKLGDKVQGLFTSIRLFTRHQVLKVIFGLFAI